MNKHFIFKVAAILMIVMLAVAALPSTPALAHPMLPPQKAPATQAAIAVGTAWTNVYHNAAAPTSASFAVAAGSNRMLVVALSYELSGNSSVTLNTGVSYGGVAMTAASANDTSSASMHSLLYYLKDNAVMDGTSKTLAVGITSGNYVMQNIWYAVFTGVDQHTTPASQNFNGTSVTSAAFSTGLTVKAGDQAVLVATAARSSGASAITYTQPASWTVNDNQPSGTTGLGLVASFAIPGSDTSTTANFTAITGTSTRWSQTGISLKAWTPNQSETYSNSGTWVAPAGVTSLTVEVWGGGGGGGADSSTSGSGGGGGGGGAYAKLNSYAVTPGNSYAYTVGGGGSGGTSGGNGGDGANSFFVSTSTLNAAGGSHGVGGNGGAGGAGGAAGATGDVHFSGGSGFTPTANYNGGGGGGSAGTAANGNSATSATGATAVTGGGPGGDGNSGILGGNGSAPSTLPGGGGGGGGARIISESGGAGAVGQIVFTYTISIPPTVTTQAVSAITTTTATGNGNVTVLGSPAPTQHGVVWNTTGTPTTADSKTTDGAVSATGAFTSAMTGLTPGQLYHVRAYATNTVDTIYGNEVTFTAYQTPVVTTQAVDGIGTTTATAHGNVTTVGVPVPSQHGFVWNTTGAPSLSNPTDSVSTEGLVAATGAYTSSISSLSVGTHYYIAAYATNDAGTVYGAVQQFDTEAILTATTGSANDISTTGTATLNGSVFPTTHTTTVTFNYGLTTAYGTTVTYSPTISGNSNFPVHVDITGLTPGQTYHFKVHASNSNGTTDGSDGSFVAAMPVTINCPSSTLTYPASETCTAGGGGGTGAYSFSVGASTGCTVGSSSGLVMITNAGTNSCSVTASKLADANYLLASSSPFSITLVKGTPILSITNSPVTYDGASHAATVSAGAVPGSAISVLTGGASTQTNAGTYPVTAGFTPTDTNNYNSIPVGTSVGNFVISKATPPLTVSPTSAIYTGAPQSTGVTSTVAGTVTHIYYNGSLTPPTNAGSYTITADFTSTNVNYNSLTGGAATPAFVINQAPQAPLYVTGPDSVGYGTAEEITTSGGSGTGALNFNSLTAGTCSVNLTTGVITPNASSGSCTVTATKLADANYTSITSASFNVLLTLGTPILYVVNSPTGYTGNPIDATVAARNAAGQTVSGTPDNILYDGDGTAPTDPGTYAVTADFTPTSSNYVPLTEASAGDFVIAGLAQVITFTTPAPVGAGYGDTYSPDAVSNSGLDVTITVDASTPDWCTIDGSGVVTFNGFGTCVLDANQEGNDIYAAAAQVQQSIIVGTRTLNVTANADDKEYDGTTTATVTLDDDRINGDDITVNYTSANFSDAAISDNKTVTVTGLSITGPDAIGYSLASTTITTTASILPIVPRVAVNGISYVLNGVTHQLDEAASISSFGNQIKVTFNEDMLNLPSTDANYNDSVTNPANYRLLFVQSNFTVQTLSCVSTINTVDHVMPIASVSYTNHGGAGPYVATITLSDYTGTDVSFNNNQNFKLFVCGTTSIADLNGINLAGDGTTTGTDFTRNFTLLGANLPFIAPVKIPATGFAPNRITQLPMQPAAKSYSALGSVWLDIPKLGIKANITGVPEVNGDWDVSWLNNDVGWLQGTSFPSLSGNSVLTGHYFNSYGTAGPFRYLGLLSVGDQIIVHAYGTQYVYQVRSLQQVDPAKVDAMIQHENTPWLTLVTCVDYLANNNFKYRLLVRAEYVGAK